MFVKTVEQKEAIDYFIAFLNFETEGFHVYSTENMQLVMQWLKYLLNNNNFIFTYEYYNNKILIHTSSIDKNFYLTLSYEANVNKYEVIERWIQKQ